MAGSSAADFKLKVELTAPLHGWLQLNLQLGNDTCSVPVSHVPSDSLEALAGAVRALTERGAGSQVTFHGEPVLHRLTLSPLSGAYVLLTVTASEKTLFAFKSERLSLCRTLWRALRRLEDAFPDGASEHWGHPFPARDVAVLGERLRATPPDAPA